MVSTLGSPFVIGIDLGTTNSAVAYIDMRHEWTGRAKVELFAVPQLVRPSVVENRPLLPSFVYLPGGHDLPPGSTGLPWDKNRSFVVGEMARDWGALVPGRLVSSSKSWLCNELVDRNAALLPWAGADEVTKMSPVDAAVLVLSHIKEAWNYTFARDNSPVVFEEQEVVLTVPASFDEVARELVCAAAERAGLRKLTLVEEPQAAFYHWIESHDGRWEQAFPGGGVALVCDIGGGTTDLSLIDVTVHDGKAPSFERIAVGAHLLLGGDNMDIALARHVERVVQTGKSLDARQWSQLAYRCREAKEILLADNAPELARVAIPGSGSRVIGGALSHPLRATEAEQLLLDGFFPICERSDTLTGRKRGGIFELGLPYESDPAIPRHILAFLRAQAPNVRPESRNGDLVRPDAILFNGGATEPTRVQQRIVDALKNWFGAENYQPKVLSNQKPDLAVALGAAYYGAVRRGFGIRISGGSARAYYVGVGTGEMERSDQVDSQTVVCLIPHGLEEGREVHVSNRDFQIVTNRPVSFPLWSSSTRIGDEPGQLLAITEDSLTALPPIRTILQYGKKGSQAVLPVELVAKVTEIGTLAVSCASTTSPHRWKLEFDLRAGWAADRDASNLVDTETLDESCIERAQRAISQCYVEKSIDPKSVVRELEAAVELRREEWPLGALRSLWPLVRDCAPKRGQTAQHESRWYNLAGFCLRPGTGLPGDDIRVRELWNKVYSEGPIHRRDAQVLREWWVMWRRTAAGLTAGQQIQLIGDINPLITSKKIDTFKLGRPAPDKAEIQELWMAAASFERIEPATRARLGDLILKQLSSKDMVLFGYWALGRIGARVPLYAGINAALPAHVTGKWLDELLTNRWKEASGCALDIVQIARKTGDRSRDLRPDLLSKLSEELSKLSDSERLTHMITHVVPLERKEQQHLLGDTIPHGLVLKEPATEGS